jgi:ectoine hydroxylase-related dioxygenase (phytanoyl-CoA dioxygenase family)
MEVIPAAVEAFARDGAVLLPGLLGPEWLALLDAGVERNLAEPSEWAQQYTPDGEPGQFFGDYCSWDRIPEFRTVAFESGLADVARQLMGSTTARFFHEHVLVKEPGTREITPWHHDQPYYCVDGDQSVSFWVPLDPVPASAGVEFIAGSHRWDRWFVPRRFVDHIPYADADADSRYELVPDLDAERSEHQILSFDVQPGDVIAFHFRTLHDAPGTEGLANRRRVVSFRWLGDDASFALRPWLHSPPFETRALQAGGPLDDDRFPLVV